VLALQVRQGVDDRLGPLVLRQQALAQELELVARRERAVAMDGSDRCGQVLRRVEEVEDLRPFGQRGGVLPVVAARVGDLGETKVRVLRQYVREVLAERLLERELLRLGPPTEANRGDEVALGVAEGQSRASHLPVTGRPLAQAALGCGIGAHAGGARATVNGCKHTVDRHGDRVRLLGHDDRFAQDLLVLLALGLPALAERLGQPIEAALGRVHVADALEQVLGLLRGHLRYDPAGLLGRSLRPEALHDAQLAVDGSQRVRRRIAAILVQPSLHAHRTGRRHVRLRAAKRAAVHPAIDLDRVGIHVRGRHHRTDDLALGLHQPGVQLLLELIELPRAGLARHRVIFQELPDPVEHPGPERLLNLRDPQLALRLGFHEADRGRAGHAPVNTPGSQPFPASGSDLHRV
jgi:hypothetical protein